MITVRRSIVVRYYFHLAELHNAIPDEEGIEVSNPEYARAEALKQIEELRRADPSSAADWAGWHLHVADASGAVVFSISLDGTSG
jgi:hypothetical protein